MVEKKYIRKKNVKVDGYRTGVRLVIYKKFRSELLYLVLKRKLRWVGYELCKGGKLKNETDLQAVKRELREETALKPLKVINLNLKDKFVYPKKYQNIFKRKGMISKVYVVEVSEFEEVRLGKEHSLFKWMSYTGAKKVLTYSNQKKLVYAVNKKLMKERGKQ
jgi:8-oxo-dGTP pyrophosphatase MutT (NUDIX family)